MKIWCRMHRHNLTHWRTAFGMPISHDEVIAAFNRMGVECVDEFPSGDAFSDVAPNVPVNKEDYLELWYGDSALWQINESSYQYKRGLVGYSRCGEAHFSSEAIHNASLCDVFFVASSKGQEFHSRDIDTPVYVLRGGIVPSQFYFIERDFSATPFVFLHAGTQWRKGSNIACEAFAKAFPTEQDVALLTISIDESEMFVKLREKYSQDDRVQFVVKLVPDRTKVLFEYYAQGHCLVYPSILEAWGRCLAEAMASGMPCLVSRTSGMLDQFTSGCGWWIEMSDKYDDRYRLPSVEDLALKMRYAYENREECKRRGVRAAEHAKHNLIWDVGIREALPILKAVYSTPYLEDIVANTYPPVKLNIGCDSLRLDGWLNVDIAARHINARNAFRQEGAPPVYIYDLRLPSPFKDGTVSAITVSQVLAVGIREAECLPFLRECYRVLERGGVIRITELDSDCFDFPSSFHTTLPMMVSLLEQAGFSAKEVAKDETTYTDRAICIDTHGAKPKVYFCEGVKK